MAPAYGWDLALTPDGQPWIVAHGAHDKTASGWRHHDLMWSDAFDPSKFRTWLYSVHAFSANDVWVGGDQGYIGHFNGSTWTERRPSAPNIRGIWGATANDVWFLYSTGLRKHWNGSELVQQPTSDVEYLGAWGSAADDVWGWGETEIATNSFRPAIDHFDGTTWTMTVLPGYGNVISLWAASATDIFVVISLNNQTRVMRGAGATWTEVTDPDVTRIYAVWGRSANEVWAVGAQGTIVRFDGQDWIPSASGTTSALSEISGTATVTWIAGDGVVLRRP